MNYYMMNEELFALQPASIIDICCFYNFSPSPLGMVTRQYRSILRNVDFANLPVSSDTQKLESTGSVHLQEAFASLTTDRGFTPTPPL